ncbi:methyltransferase family protein [Haloplanus sp. C73]|uniref:methyltransferase family protein n=1 Tax=Haloplanus sp. C73 TaxID=3421641 RepID=UPI003EB6A394
MTPTQLAFAAGLLAAAGVYGIVIGTLLTDHEWWPPGDRTAAYYVHWTCVGVFDVALLLTAALDWGGWGLATPVRVGGVALALLGTAVFVWGARAMRSAETMGVTGELYTDGPYAYTRNPQYVGMIVGVPGIALAVGSALVAALATVHVGWVLLLPRAEEPHLRAEFGKRYERYAARVPRFVGFATVRRALDPTTGEPPENS